MKFLFSCFSSISHEWAQLYNINILPTRRSRLNSRFKKRTRCYSFTALNRASDVLAADWLSQTHVKNYRNFSRVVIRFFSVVEIPIKHSSLYNKVSFLTLAESCSLFLRPSSGQRKAMWNSRFTQFWGRSYSSRSSSKFNLLLSLFVLLASLTGFS